MVLLVPFQRISVTSLSATLDDLNSEHTTLSPIPHFWHHVLLLTKIYFGPIRLFTLVVPHHNIWDEWEFFQVWDHCAWGLLREISLGRVYIEVKYLEISTFKTTPTCLETSMCVQRCAYLSLQFKCLRTLTFLLHFMWEYDMFLPYFCLLQLQASERRGYISITYLCISSHTSQNAWHGAG